MQAFAVHSSSAAIPHDDAVPSNLPSSPVEMCLIMSLTNCYSLPFYVMLPLSVLAKSAVVLVVFVVTRLFKITF